MWSCLRAPTLVVLVQLPLGSYTYLLFRSDVVKFVWKTSVGEAGSIILLIFLQPSSEGKGWWGGPENLMWGQLKSHIFVLWGQLKLHLSTLISLSCVRLDCFFTGTFSCCHFFHFISFNFIFRPLSWRTKQTSCLSGAYSRLSNFLLT